MPRTKNIGNYPPMFFEIVELCTAKENVTVNFEGENAKKIAEKQRFTFYGFVKALGSAGTAHEVAFAQATGVEAILRETETGWSITFRDRDQAPFWEAAKTGIAEAKARLAERESRAKQLGRGVTIPTDAEAPQPEGAEDMVLAKYGSQGRGKKE